MNETMLRKHVVFHMLLIQHNLSVPTMYTRLIQGYKAMDPELEVASASAGSQLHLIMCGSSALPLPVMQQWEIITGHQLLVRYVMTEFVMAVLNPLKGIQKG